MNSDDDIVAASANAPALLLYDFFKHISTLSLIALGGALGIAPDKVGREELALVLLSIGLAGGVAIMGLLAITRAQAAGKAMPAKVKLYRTLSGSLFSFGIGMFLVISVYAL